MSKKFYHISYETNNTIECFVPRIPNDKMLGENDTIKRVCVSDDLQKCFNAISWQDDLENEEIEIVRVYEFNLDNDADILDNEYLYKNGLVDDSMITNEYWILKEIKPSKVYDIKISCCAFEPIGIIPYNMLDKDDFCDYVTAKECTYLEYELI